MTTYWVYENWTHKRARVHLADCSFCLDGKGNQPTDSGQNGMWHGPFQDRDAAFDKARHTRQKDTKGCGHCSP